MARTLSKVPDLCPDTNLGSFEVVANGLQERTVYVYWKQIPRTAQNGPDFRYRITEVFEAGVPRLLVFYFYFDEVWKTRKKNLLKVLESFLRTSNWKMNYVVRGFILSRTKKCSKNKVMLWNIFLNLLSTYFFDHLTKFRLRIWRLHRFTKGFEGKVKLLARRQTYNQSYEKRFIVFLKVFSLSCQKTM